MHDIYADLYRAGMTRADVESQLRRLGRWPDGSPTPAPPEGAPGAPDDADDRPTDTDVLPFGLSEHAAHPHDPGAPPADMTSLR